MYAAAARFMGSLGVPPWEFRGGSVNSGRAIVAVVLGVLLLLGGALSLSRNAGAPHANVSPGGALGELFEHGRLQTRLTFDEALDRLFDRGYPQRVDDRLYRMPGTNRALGFSWGGTWADDARAVYLASQLRAIGLRNVRLEPVPVDVFDFRSASVTVGDRTIVASTFAGIPPTPRRGLTAEVVYAYNGTAQDFDALEAAGIDVEGKIVLVDANFEMWWLNYPAAEATYRGAVGLIMTYAEEATYPWYSVASDAFGSNDAEYDMSYAPMVYISQDDGNWLKGELNSEGAGVTATMKLLEKVQLATEGGVGYNVFADLPGRVRDGSFVLLGAHHDVHFRAGTDDSSCVAAILAMAKAMVMSGYRPQHTVRIMITTAEEFGYTDAWYDWSIGAWWAITQAHPDWAGRIRAFLNLDYFSGDAPLTMETIPELTTVLAGQAEDDGDLLPFGYDVITPMSTWQDGWTFTAAGAPTVAFGAVPEDEDAGSYHTNYMLPSQVNWSLVADYTKFIFRIVKQFDRGLLPYDLSARADDLAAFVIPDDLLGAGADPDAVDRLAEAIAAFQDAAAAYEARKDTIPARHVPAVNAMLRQIEKQINDNLTALSAWDWQIYPHEQVLNDVLSLEWAIDALQQDPADTDTALEALSNVALTFYGLMLSHDVYLYDLARRDPNYDRVTWGAQGHLIHYLDVIPQFNAIASGTWDGQTIADLQAMLDLDLSDLNGRLNAMSDALEQVTPLVEALG